MVSQTQSLSVIDLLRSDLDTDWAIDYDDLSSETPYDIDTLTKTITIHNFGLSIQKAKQSAYFVTQIDLITIEAMRMANHIDHFETMTQSLKPKDVIILARVIEADIQSIKILAAWMARSNNNYTPWRHILCGDTADMAESFQRGFESFLSQGFDQHKAIKKSVAMAFNQWFADPARAQKCDHNTLTMMDDTKYFGEGDLSSDDIYAFVHLFGEGDAYMDITHCEDILINPYYNFMRDKINQVHLRHIINDLNKTYVGDLAFHDDILASRFMTLH